MNGADVLRDLSLSGIEIAAAGERLRFTASRPVTAAERQMIAEHKPALLEQLAAEDGLRAHLHALAAGAGIPAGVVAALSGGALAGLLGVDDDAGLLVLLDYRCRTMIARGELPATADAELTGAIIDVATPGAVGKLAMPGAAGGDP